MTKDKKGSKNTASAATSEIKGKEKRKGACATASLPLLPFSRLKREEKKTLKRRKTYFIIKKGRGKKKCPASEPESVCNNTMPYVFLLQHPRIWGGNRGRGVLPCLKTCVNGEKGGCGDLPSISAISPKRKKKKLEDSKPTPARAAAQRKKKKISKAPPPPLHLQPAASENRKGRKRNKIPETGYLRRPRPEEKKKKKKRGGASDSPLILSSTREIEKERKKRGLTRRSTRSLLGGQKNKEMKKGPALAARRGKKKGKGRLETCNIFTTPFVHREGGGGGRKT